MIITTHKYDRGIVEEYARISIAFEVRSMFDVEQIESGTGGLRLIERPVDKPFIKDYDALPGGGPKGWAGQFDVKTWRFLLARKEDASVGAAAVAFWTKGIDMFGGCRDFAVLWDIRVKPEYRGKGVGGELFRQAVDTAREMNCSKLKIETQNINVPACRFYVAQGCYLGNIDRFGYAGVPSVKDEVMLIWYYDL